MITGVWISPDRRRMAVQFEGDVLTEVDARFEQLGDLDMVPIGWEPLYDPEEGP